MRTSSILRRFALALASILLVVAVTHVAQAQATGATQPTEPSADAGAPKAPEAAATKLPAKDPTKEPAKEDAKEPKEETKAYALEGYVNLGIGVRAVPKAVPRDQLTYGLRSSVAGLIVRGTPFDRFSYIVHFGVNPEALALVSGVDLADKNGDGTDQDVATEEKEVTIVPVEEVSIAYAITSWWNVKGGHFYIPFSPGASVLVTSQMFPSRPEPTRVFMIGADQGVATTATFIDERIRASIGVFNGSSLALNVPGTTTFGPVYAALVDAAPLGKMPDSEGDPKRGPFRFAIGTGVLYRMGKLFESTGYEATRFREVRLDAAARIAFLGMFLQGEVLRRQQRDDLSGRPASATGAYVQGSYFIPLPGTHVALAPLARYGVAIEDQDFASRKTIEIEAGIAFYPHAEIEEPNKLRFILQYDGEQRLPEREISHGGVIHAQLRW
jgi:hypothetical protein